MALLGRGFPAGCASMGDTYEEAIGNIREAVTCHLEGLRADGLPVPPSAI